VKKSLLRSFPLVQILRNGWQQLPPFCDFLRFCAMHFADRYFTNTLSDFYDLRNEYLQSTIGVLDEPHTSRSSANMLDFVLNSEMEEVLKFEEDSA